MTLLLHEVWTYAWSRLSVTGAKCWASLNPEGPSHWCKRKVIDHIDDFRGHVVPFLMRHNPSLDEETIARYEASFTGHHYRRLIEGIWSAASGACFPDWTTVDDEPDWPVAQWTGAFDWAVSGTLALLQIGQSGDRRRAVVRRELVRTGRDEGLLVEEDAATLCEEWWKQTTGQHPSASAIIVDPSTPATFQGALRRRGFRVQPGVNDVVPGIVSTASRLAAQHVVIHRDCERLCEELGGYVWDEKKADIGIDEPVKADDHCVDALRYFVHTRMPWHLRQQYDHQPRLQIELPRLGGQRVVPSPRMGRGRPLQSGRQRFHA